MPTCGNGELGLDYMFWGQVWRCAVYPVATEHQSSTRPV